MHGFSVKVAYKPFLVFRKGKAKPTKIWYDNFGLRLKTKDWDTAQGLHKWGQSESALYEPIDAFTEEGNTILDPFMGSGTTGVACMRMNRKFIGIEKDPIHFENAMVRLNNILAYQGKSDLIVSKGVTMKPLFAV